VGQPVDNRFSWIKGALEFEALRQACIDPEGRAYVGEQPPRSAMPSQVISHVRIDDADWATTPDIPLNPGLVAIIGARGSGKTALVDVIAAGCDTITPAGWDADENISPSFLTRARTLIGDATATLTWGGGATVPDSGSRRIVAIRSIAEVSNGDEDGDSVGAARGAARVLAGAG
jgi:hypothetical protein